MDDLRTAPTVAIAGCVLYLVALAVPYLLVDSTSAVGTYYGSGALSPAVPALFALLGIIVFAAGREGRTDPTLAAGVGLVLGVFVVGLSLLWALTVPESFVFSLTGSSLVEYHRWALVVAGVPVPLGAAWFTRALGVF